MTDDAYSDQEGGGKKRGPLLKPVVPRTITDQIAEQLRQLINSGEYKAGDRIPSERELASRLGVGRPAVREALRELKAQGLLVVGRGAQGTNVANLPSPSFTTPLAPLLGAGAERIAELMEIRSAVEIEAAGLAARRATIEDLHRLSILAAGPSKLLSSDDDVAFHAAIAQATHNPLFERVIGEPVALLHDHMEAILNAYYAEPGGGIALHQQHEAIRGAIRAGDEQKARQAMRQHLDYVARGLAQLAGTGRMMRLVFIDLNGTLASGPRHISERVKRTIGNVREGGVEVVLVSSRPPRAMRPFYQQLGLMTPDDRLRRGTSVERPGRCRILTRVAPGGAGRRDSRCRPRPGRRGQRGERRRVVHGPAGGPGSRRDPQLRGVRAARGGPYRRGDQGRRADRQGLHRSARPGRPGRRRSPS